MKNLKIWAKMALGIGILLILLIVISAVSLTVMKQANTEADAISKAYTPLQALSTEVTFLTNGIPANMLTYLLTGNDKAWNKVEELYKKVETQGRVLKAHVKAFPQLIPDTGRSDAVVNELADFYKLLLESHSQQAEFIKLRTQMTKTGANILEVSSALLGMQNDVLTKAISNQDNAEITRIVPLVRQANLILSMINVIRSNMLRALAEQKHEWAKDNIPLLFPELLKQVAELKSVSRIQEVRAMIEDLSNDIVKFRDIQDKMLKVWERTRQLTEERNKARDTALEVTEAISAVSSKLQRDAVTSVDAQTDMATLLLSIVSVVALLVGVLVGVVLTRGITRPVSQTVKFAQDVAGGALDQRLGLARKDEIGQLSVALDAMVDALNEKIADANHKNQEAEAQSRKAQEAMTQAEAASKEARTKTEAMLVAADKLEQVGGVVSSASTQLSAQIEQSDRGAAESAQRLSEAATAMNEMNATVQEVAKNAGSASSASAETKQKAEAGAQVVEKAVHSIEEVHQMSLELKQDMTQLNEHAQDITRIMGVISDIADQTNLLALNAAIEAARAGEAGRGFAVVADEVRKLAEKTMASTNDVGNAIKAIQESTAKSMAGVDNAVERIGEATELASQSGAALQEIVDTVEATGDQVNAIATASEEQSAASEEINQSIVQVNDMARQTAEAMAEAAKAVSDLAAQAQGLTDLIQELKAA